MRFIFHLLALAVVLSAYSGVEGKESDVTSLQIGVQVRVLANTKHLLIDIFLLIPTYAHIGK